MEFINLQSLARWCGRDRCCRGNSFSLLSATKGLPTSHFNVRSISFLSTFSPSLALVLLAFFIYATLQDDFGAVWQTVCRAEKGQQVSVKLEKNQVIPLDSLVRMGESCMKNPTLLKAFHDGFAKTATHLFEGTARIKNERVIIAWKNNKIAYDCHKGTFTKSILSKFHRATKMMDKDTSQLSKITEKILQKRLSSASKCIHKSQLPIPPSWDKFCRTFKKKQSIIDDFIETLPAKQRLVKPIFYNLSIGRCLIVI